LSNEFEPKIALFACNWCTYAALDLAGTSRMKYPPNFRVIRVMCSGRVDPQFILEAFKNGADGVLVAGCHLGDCHYIEGNFKALRRVTLLRRMLDRLGIERERVRLEWISASEATKFVEVAKDMVEQIKALGPLSPRLEVSA
jgi:F420-non-reducing hydrogenase iron-sulfur subunit